MKGPAAGLCRVAAAGRERTNANYTSFRGGRGRHARGCRPVPPGVESVPGRTRWGEAVREGPGGILGGPAGGPGDPGPGDRPRGRGGEALRPPAETAGGGPDGGTVGGPPAQGHPGGDGRVPVRPG